MMATTGYTAEAWREYQDAISRASAELFQFHAGREVEILASAMQLLAECFEDEVLRSASTRQARVCVGLAGQAYQQLLSCWEDLEKGRLTSALAHWRSLSELPDYLMAAGLNADFAESWSDRTRRKIITPENARRTVKKIMNANREESGDEWAVRRSEDDRLLQPLSHVSSIAAGLTILMPGPGANTNFAAPGGYWSPDVLAAALRTALLSIEILSAASVAFGHAARTGWAEEVFAFVREALPVLHNEMKTAKGTLQAFHHGPEVSIE